MQLHSILATFTSHFIQNVKENAILIVVYEHIVVNQTYYRQIYEVQNAERLFPNTTTSFKGIEHVRNIFMSFDKYLFYK